MAIFLAFIVIAVLGLVLGIGLQFADGKLRVDKDEKLMELEEAMPGANCGGCGFAGCSAYAEAIYKGEAEAGLCSPGGPALAARIGEILGIEVSAKEQEVAFIFCRGSKELTSSEFEYSGISDCNAASLAQGGPSSCKAGCLHFGSCMAVCPAGAIFRAGDGNIAVDKQKCIGCKKCTKICPNGVIKMVPLHASHLVACNNHESGAKVRSYCQVGCIGCKLCEIKVENSCFKVDNFLSYNTYAEDQSAGAKAAEICPRKCIVER